MSDDSSDHRNDQLDQLDRPVADADFFDAATETSADPSPHRRRNTILALVAAFVVVAGVLAAIIIPIIGASHRRQQQAHATALTDCTAAQREFATLNTTYTTTISSAGKLARGDEAKTVSEEHATALTSKIDHIDDTHTVSSLTTANCAADMSTAALTDLAGRFTIANTSMVNRMRDVQTDADTLKQLVEGARNADRRGELQKELTFANTVYARSENHAPVDLRTALQAQIEQAKAMLEPTATATNAQINDALAALTKATDAVVAAMPLDCELTACVALTFDDGPNKQVTPRLLDALHAADAPATFFVQGQFVSGSNKQLLATMAAQGHEIGSMSWRHRQLHTLSADELGRWFHDTDEVIEDAGVAKPTLFRPPDGAWSEDVVDTARADGQSVILWNVDARDWDAKTSADDIANDVLNSASAGAIIALHDGNERTVESIPQIVSGLRERGFHLVTVSQLLTDELDPGTVFYARGDTAQDSLPQNGNEPTR